MKKVISLTLFILSLTLSSHAQNRWKVYGGGSISHLCEKPWLNSDGSYRWGGGAFVGCGYEINFNSRWSLSPQLEFAFSDNGAYLSSDKAGSYNRYANWKSIWSLNIPILVNFRISISDMVKFRIGLGPYLQEALVGRQYNPITEKRESMSGNFGNRFNVGPMGEVAVETGNHLYYMFRTQYPVLKEGWVRKTICLSIGIGYSF
ncbi:MAG: PorT family protein [Muribaculaceae bacterium]|nr:PorT family protein [Muribaculaceae bacterium]